MRSLLKFTSDLGIMFTCFGNAVMCLLLHRSLSKTKTQQLTKKFGVGCNFAP